MGLESCRFRLKKGKLLGLLSNHDKGKQTSEKRQSSTQTVVAPIRHLVTNFVTSSTKLGNLF